MKKILFVLCLMFQFSAYSRAGAGGTGYVADFSESNGGGGVSNLEGPVGFGRLNNHESMGIAGSGRIMEDRPGSLDIGGFGGMRTPNLPTSFGGNIGGSF